MERVPDKAVNIQMGGQEILISNNYDTIHLFRKLGHGIIKVFVEEGLATWHLPVESAEWLAEQVGIEPHDRQTMTEKEYEGYIEYQTHTLDDSWLD